MNDSGKHGKLIYKVGDSSTYGINCGIYPRHNFVDNPLGLQGDPFTVYAAGSDEWIHGCERTRICSDVSSFELVDEGVMSYSSPRGVFRIPEQHVFLVHYQEDSEMHAFSERMLKRSIIMPGSISAQIIDAMGLKYVDVIDVSGDKEIGEYFTRITEVLTAQEPGFSVKASELSFGLALKLSNLNRTRGYPPELSRILELIHTNISHNFSLRELSDFAGTSSRTLNNMFNKFFGQSPIDYILHHRIRVAERYLLDYQRRIKEIANDLGYANQFYFARDFKKRTGISPSEFRNKKQPDTLATVKK